MYDGRKRMYEWVFDYVSKSILLRPYFQDGDEKTKKKRWTRGEGGRSMIDEVRRYI